jgi:hypothetical protein
MRPMVMSKPCDSFTNSVLAVVTASGIDSEPDEVDGEPGVLDRKKGGIYSSASLEPTKRYCV